VQRGTGFTLTPSAAGTSDVTLTLVSGVLTPNPFRSVGGDLVGYGGVHI
jgi:hypothetical protein